MDTNFNKVVIVSLCDEFSKKIGKNLSQELDMMFCDTKDLVEYELIDKDALKKISTKEYLEGAEKKVIAHIASFENVVVAINFDYLANNFDILKYESLVIFLKLKKEYVEKHGGTVNFLAYKSRTQKLEKISTLTIEIEEVETKKVCKKIINALGGIV